MVFFKKLGKTLLLIGNHLVKVVLKLLDQLMN